MNTAHTHQATQTPGVLSQTDGTLDITTNTNRHVTITLTTNDSHMDNIAEALMQSIRSAIIKIGTSLNNNMNNNSSIVSNDEIRGMQGDLFVLKELWMTLNNKGFDINTLLPVSHNDGDFAERKNKQIDAFYDINRDIRNMVTQVAYLLAIQGHRVHFPDVRDYIHQQSVDLDILFTDPDMVYDVILRQ